MSLSIVSSLAVSLALAVPAVTPPASGSLSDGGLVAPVQSLDDLPDGDLDYEGDEASPPEGGVGEPKEKRTPVGDEAEAETPAAAPEEGDGADDAGEAVGSVQPELVPIPGPGEEVPPPPDERVDETTPVDDAGEVVPEEPWTDEEISGDLGRTPVSEDFDAIEREEQQTGRLVEDEEEVPLIENPLFWGGVAGGALLLSAAAVGSGFLIYGLVYGDTGTVTVVLE